MLPMMKRIVTLEAQVAQLVDSFSALQGVNYSVADAQPSLAVGVRLK